MHLEVHVLKKKEISEFFFFPGNKQSSEPEGPLAWEIPSSPGDKHVGLQAGRFEAKWLGNAKGLLTRLQMEMLLFERVDIY